MDRIPNIDYANYNKTKNLTDRLLAREKVPKDSFQSKIKRTPAGEIRPLFVNLTPFSAMYNRSPFMSLVFPTKADVGRKMT
jgi:hypothetical protein